MINQYLAIKIVDRNPKKKRLNALSRQRKSDAGKPVDQNEIRKEIAILKKLHHPNVVNLKEIIDDPESSKLFMVLEYCDGGEVRFKLPDNTPAMSLHETRNIFRDVLLGLEYLHHQGIIHRDIKPSNLLYAAGGRVKISDFGCSHFSEALLAASEREDQDESCVDDIELAKTAGSPAFFAPEMCYSDVSDEPSTAPMSTNDTVPTFTLRPPSTVVEEGSEHNRISSDPVPFSPGRGTTMTPLPTEDESAAGSAASLRPSVSRTQSVVSIPRRPRHPITNAIDVWALGVTLYCLLFGKTPFDAPNEYLLMQVIPYAQYDIPATLGRDRLATAEPPTDEVREVLDLLKRLLEKDAPKRISLEQAKRHPFTLRGVHDPAAWLATTDPHAQTFVTVTNDEVAAAFTRGTRFRDRLKRGVKVLTHRLGFLGSRSGRRGSITDSDVNGEASSGPDVPRRTASATEANGTAVPGPALSRKLSRLSRSAAHSRAESPRPGLLAAQMQASAAGAPATTPVLLHPPPCPDASTPRQMPSISSLERFRADRNESPPAAPQRRPSTDAERRPRSSSNASSASSSLFGHLGRGFLRKGHGQGHGHGHRANGHSTPSAAASPSGKQSSGDDIDGTFFASSLDSQSQGAFPSSSDSHNAEVLRGRSYDDIVSRPSVDTFESSSPRSHILAPSPSPDRFNKDLNLRRGSGLSEDIRPVMEAEEVDWTGSVPDSDDEDDVESDDEYDAESMPRVRLGSHGSYASYTSNRSGSGSAQNSFSYSYGRHFPSGVTSHGSMSSAPAGWDLSHSATDLDARRSPSDSYLSSRRGVSPPQAPSSAVSLLRPAGGIDLGRLQRGSPCSYRGRSPLGLGDASPREDGEGEGEPTDGDATPSPRPSCATSGVASGIALGDLVDSGSVYRPYASRTAPSLGVMHSGMSTPCVPEPTRYDDADDDDDDDGLVLSRRRKGSVLSRQSSVMSRSPLSS